MIRRMLPSATIRQIAFDPETNQNFRRAEIAYMNRGHLMKDAWVTFSTALRGSLGPLKASSGRSPPTLIEPLDDDIKA